MLLIENNNNMVFTEGIYRLVDFYACAILTPPNHSWNGFLFTCICPLFYAISCKGSKCGCTRKEMVVNTLCNPNLAHAHVLALCKPRHTLHHSVILLSKLAHINFVATV